MQEGQKQRETQGVQGSPRHSWEGCPSEAETHRTREHCRQREWNSLSGRGNSMCKGPEVREHVACQQDFSDSVLSERTVVGGRCSNEGGG